MLRALRSPSWLWVVLFPAALQVRALPPAYYAVNLACEPQPERPALRLTWPQVDYARQYTVRKRIDGQHDWGDPLAILPADSTGFTDLAIQTGIAYEYEVRLELTLAGYGGETIYAYSYIASGIRVSVADRMGTVLLVVDSSLSAALGPALARYESDLAGAGWSVVRREVSREAPPRDVKELILAEHNAHPDLRTLVLIGHIPVPYSGNIAPDLHERHRGAWPADGYYGDLAGEWTDQTVSVQSQDSPSNDNFPGDGKFDQSEFPAPVALEVGRIDFWNLPSFAGKSEVELLNGYFEKNHRFRHRLFNAERRGLMHDNFGDVEGDAPAVDAWRHFPQLFGHNKLQEIGPNQFLPILNGASYLWAYGAGGGDYYKADGVADSGGFAANAPQAVFMILHGSYFGDWNTQDNFLRAALASPGWTLASIWSGLPHWYMHHLALGGTLGFSTRLSQNNRDEYKSYRNFAANQTHIALMGDPTLEVFPVIPPSNLSAAPDAEGIRLSWQPSPDEGIVGYKVYRASSDAGPFEALTPVPITTAEYIDKSAGEARVYLVRAVKLEHTGSGTYYHASQGVFARAASSEPHSASIAVSDAGAITLNIGGPAGSAFEVLASANGGPWQPAGTGVLDAQGRGEFRDAENGARFKIYRVLWP